jgi:hypothetical protein
MGQQNRIRRRRVCFGQPGEVADEAERLLTGGYERAGQWSLAQVCEHLSQTVEGSVDASNGFGGFLLPIWKRISARPVLHLMLLTRWIPSGVKLPAGALPTSTDDAEAVARLKLAMETLAKHHGAWAKHPFFGGLSGKTWKRYHLIHCAHHMGFLVPRASNDRVT